MLFKLKIRHASFVKKDNLRYRVVVDTFSIINVTRIKKEDALSVPRIFQLLKLIFKRTKINKSNFNLRFLSSKQIRKTLNANNVNKCQCKWNLFSDILILFIIALLVGTNA